MNQKFAKNFSIEEDRPVYRVTYRAQRKAQDKNRSSKSEDFVGAFELFDDLLQYLESA